MIKKIILVIIEKEATMASLKWSETIIDPLDGKEKDKSFVIRASKKDIDAFFNRLNMLFKAVSLNGYFAKMEDLQNIHVSTNDGKVVAISR